MQVIFISEISYKKNVSSQNPGDLLLEINL